MVEHLSDEDLQKLPRGGHDYRKLYAAYKTAIEHRGQPDGDPGQDGEGLDARRRDRGAQRDAPDQEDDAERAEDVPRPALPRHPRRRARGRASRRTTTRARTRPSTSTCMARRRVLDGPCPSGSCGAEPLARRPGHVYAELLAGTGREAAGVDDHRVRAPAAQAARATRSSAAASCRSSPTRRAPSVSTRCSAT